MAWTTPRDWTAGEVVTESMMDVHVKDNLAYLKAVFDGTAAQTVSFSGAQVLIGAGTVSLPSLAFISDPNTGIFSSFADELAIVAGGAYTARFGGGRAFFQDGALATPGISFVNDIDSGLYRIAADQLCLSAGGQNAWGARADGIICDVAATSISLSPSPTRQLRVWSAAGTLLGYIPIHPGA